MTVVLDSWAVLRYLEDAPRVASLVARLLGRERPVMSWINLGEVSYIVQRAAGAEEATAAVRDLRRVVDVRLPTADLVLQAASIKAQHPLAYADAFAAATTSLVHDAILWTGDPELLVEGAPWRWRDLRSG